jgi:hypothetical protein
MKGLFQSKVKVTLQPTISRPVRLEVEVNLRPTVSRPVSPSVRRPSVTRGQFFFLLEISFELLIIVIQPQHGPQRKRIFQ